MEVVGADQIPPIFHRRRLWILKSIRFYLVESSLYMDNLGMWVVDGRGEGFTVSENLFLKSPFVPWQAALYTRRRRVEQQN